MQKLEIQGGKKLFGTIKISGSKNATLPILAATILTDKKVIINNVPSVRDVTTMIALLGDCLLYTSPSPRDGLLSRMPSSA